MQVVDVDRHVTVANKRPGRRAARRWPPLLQSNGTSVHAPECRLRVLLIRLPRRRLGGPASRFMVRGLISEGPESIRSYI
jgi:hypothetical protein